MDTPRKVKGLPLPGSGPIAPVFVPRQIVSNAYERCPVTRANNVERHVRGHLECPGTHFTDSVMADKDSSRRHVLVAHVLAHESEEVDIASSSPSLPLA